ncbi:MAG: glutamate 5-kinase [Candidatus Hydrogenedentes bacterium]|nr:glutamate 5-kinase [Candidatus Hydrogenedentota bacterium]
MNTSRTDIKTLVVKIGTSLLSGEGGFDGRVLEQVVMELADLKRESGLNILIVSSGAIGCGMDRLGIKERPRALRLKQATAAVGQARLMHYYQTLFETYGQGLQTAQVLLSAEDLDDRRRYLNIRNTIQTVFDLGSIVPVVNENDSVAIDELKFGDNDTLAARVAAKIGADVLIVLSDVDGLFDRDPAQHRDARLVEVVERITADIEALAGDTGAQTSVGGMKTKLTAARIACATGVRTVIANGRTPGIIRGVLAGTARCTTFAPSSEGMSHRKRWIAFGRAVRGTVHVDAGACRALRERGGSLLPAGVTGVTGRFETGAAVRIVGPDDTEIGHGLVNYSSADIDRIKGCKSREIDAVLGARDYDEVIHRDNLAVL